MKEASSNRWTNPSRRKFLAAAAKTAAVVGTSSLLAAPEARAREDAGDSDRGICVFSKCLQWLDYPAMAEMAAEAGFDGVDLTVRPGGHVLPERVEDDLPRAVEAAGKAGIRIPMIVTSIIDPGDPQTEKILKTADRLGIRYYRPGYYRYTDSAPIKAQLDEIKPRLRDLAAMNQQYSVAGTYQNHAGVSYVGASLWDLHYLLEGLDRRWIGSQFDIRHAVLEGGTTWPVSLRLLADSINTLAVKDFYWARQDSEWTARNCPLGEGMVDLAGYAAVLKQYAISGPTSLHLEYALGGAEHGDRKITVEKKVILDAMRSDLSLLRKVLESKPDRVRR